MLSTFIPKLCNDAISPLWLHGNSMAECVQSLLLSALVSQGRCHFLSASFSFFSISPSLKPRHQVEPQTSLSCILHSFILHAPFLH